MTAPGRSSGRSSSSGGAADSAEARAGAPTPPAELLEPLDAALDALTEAHVGWCLLRAPAAPVDEVDLLVAPAGLVLVEEALAPLGFAVVPAWGRGSHRFFVAYDESSDRWLKLDLVTELAYGRFQEFRTDAAAGCLARCERLGRLRALAPEDEFWSLLLHCLLDKGAVRPAHGRRLRELAAAVGHGGPLARALGAACPEAWNPANVLAAARDGDWPALVALARPIARRWTRQRPLAVARRALGGRALRRMTKLLTLVRRRGLRVVLLGPDGAGKSTLAAALETSFYVPGRRLYAGLYPAGSRGRGVPGLRLASRVIRLRWASLVASYHQARGRLVIFDRYAYDALLPAGAAPLRSRIRRWLLARSCPEPDLVVVLDAPAEVLYARKGEHTVEILDAQRRRYLRLGSSLRSAVVVDVTAEADAVRRAVTALVWARYRDRRFRPRREGARSVGAEGMIRQ